MWLVVGHWFGEGADGERSKRFWGEICFGERISRSCKTLKSKILFFKKKMMTLNFLLDHATSTKMDFGGTLMRRLE
jgi:hypothetical protein